MLLLSAAIVALAARAGLAADRAAVEDSARGAVLMGAWGDALGAGWEVRGMAGEVCDACGGQMLPFCELYDEPQCSGYNQSWGIWISTDEAAGEHLQGVVTDDTSFRAMILQPFLATLDALPPMDVLEPALKAYVNDTEAALWALEAQGQLGVLDARRRGMLSDLLVMWDAAGVPPVEASRPRGSNPFYAEGQPACFSLYFFIEMVLAYQGAPADAFAAMSSVALDQEYGHVVSGAVGAVGARAAALAPGLGDFGPWFVAALQEELAGAQGSDEYAAMALAHMQAAEVAGAAAGADPLGAWLEVYSDADLTPQHPLHNSDPLLMAMEMTFFSAWCPAANVTCAVELMAEAPGDADTVASFHAALVGMYYGEAYLRSLPELDAQLDMVDSYLQGYYAGYDYKGGAEALTRFVSP